MNNNIVSGCLSGHFLSLMLYGLPSSEENGSCIKITILNCRKTFKVYLCIESGHTLVILGNRSCYTWNSISWLEIFILFHWKTWPCTKYLKSGNIEHSDWWIFFMLVYVIGYSQYYSPLPPLNNQTI